MVKPYYDVKLGKTYHAQGFVNIGVSASRYLPNEDRDEITIDVADFRKLKGHFDRTTNRNRTPRVFGGTQLRDWFNLNFQMGEYLRVIFASPTEIRLEKRDDK
ncbi:hypothetical protein [Planktotalea sp.]|uniref:hypothetical protein n=1 Tax=Planktotalea sp. TaxID=2029877 RepID=UPI003297E140